MSCGYQVRTQSGSFTQGVVTPIRAVLRPVTGVKIHWIIAYPIWEQGFITNLHVVRKFHWTIAYPVKKKPGNEASLQNEAGNEATQLSSFTG